MMENKELSAIENEQSQKKAINVIMIGASRSGKTSILASMLSNMKNPEITQYFVFNEHNAEGYKNLSPKQREDIRLTDIIDSMTDMVNPNIAGRSVPKLSALFGTDAMFTYKFKLESGPVRESKNELEIHFTDVPGEFCVQTAFPYDEYISKVKDSQILVVAVDVPSMMYAKLHHKAKINRGMNLPDEVQNAALLLGQNYNDANLYRMVVFVPIKCEYWIHNNMMDEVYNEIKKVYETSIANIEQYSKVRSFIMPVETIGGCEFDHHSELNESLIMLSDKPEIGNLEHEDEFNGRFAYRCEKLGSTQYRLKNGEIYQSEPKDEFILTSDRPYHPYFLEEVGVQIPYTWYIRNNGVGYAPKNCEQLLLQVVRFSIEALIQRNLKNMTLLDIIKNMFTLGRHKRVNIKLDDFAKSIKEMMADEYYDDTAPLLKEILENELIKDTIV